MNELATTNDYDDGLQDGSEGKPLDVDRATKSPDYYEGWKDGVEDRPSLEELILDYQNELNDPFGY